MDEVVYSLVEVKIEEYEQKIKSLVEVLLEIDEKNYSNQCNLKEVEVVA